MSAMGNVLLIPASQSDLGEVLSINGTAFAFRCNKCDRGLSSVRGGGNRFCMCCPSCGRLLFIYLETGIGLPLLIWNDDPPEGVSVGEYAKQRIAAARANLALAAGEAS